MTLRTLSRSCGLLAAPFLGLAALSFLGFAACSAPSNPNGSGDGDGDGMGSGNGNGDGDIGNIGDGDIGNIGDGDIGDGDGGTDECGAVLPVIYRDFKGNGEAGGHADFELSKLYVAGGSNWPSGNYGEPTPGNAAFKGLNQAGCGLVAVTLGADLKPTFASGLGLMRQLSPMRNAQNNPPVVQSVTGCVPWDWGWVPPNVIGSALTFGDWYNTKADVNMEVPGEIVLTEGVIDNPAFFPLDGQGFGNTPGSVPEHNYHFTTEAHVTFEYVPGTAQVFSFRGDDDLWVFINGNLAMDLGGVHEPMQGSINFDTQAAALGISAGGVFSMDIFHAERQTVESNFRVETNISCFTPVTIVK